MQFIDPFASAVSIQPNQPLTILLIEDSEIDAHLFKSVFGRCELNGSTLLISHSMEEGLRTLNGAKGINAVFVDLNLPDCEGIESLKTLLPVAGSRPVIVISAESDQALIREALRNGAQDYLVKGSYDAVRLEQALLFSIERRRVSAALRASQDNYETLFQNNPLPAWLFRPDTLQIVMVNEAAIRHYGYTREEFLAMTIRDFRAPEDLPRLDELVRKRGTCDYLAVAEGWRHRTKDGTLIDVSISLNEVTFNEEKLIYVVVRDVTDQKRITSLLEDNSRRLDLAASSGGMIMVDVNYQKGSIHVSSRREGILGYSVNFESTVSSALRFVHPADRDVILEAIQNGKSGVKQDIQFRIRDPRSGNIIWVERRSYFVYDDEGVPIESRGVLVDITALKQYEADLLKSYQELEVAAERQSAILDSLPAQIALLDKDGVIVAVNQAWRVSADGIGQSEAWIGKSYFATAPCGADALHVHAGTRAVLRGETKRFEAEYPCETTGGWVKTVVCPIASADKGGAVIMHMDISAQKNVEHDLLQSRANLLSIFESTEDSYVLIDTEYRILALNRPARKEFPYFAQPNAIGKSVLSFMVEERKKPFQDALDVVFNERKATQYVVVYNFQPGVPSKYYQITVSPVLSDGRFLGYTICVHDITSHKEIEQTLADREQRFRALIENSGDMFTITDAQQRIVYASPNIEKILRYPLSEISGKPFYELIHSDDRPYYSFVVEQASRNKGTLFHKSNRMLTRDGQERWIEGSIIDLEHIPSVGGIVTNFRDITEKVNTQRELDHNRYILDKANEVTRIGYWVLDLKPGERALSWSPQLFTIFGLHDVAFAGEPDSFDAVVHPEDKTERDAALTKALRENVGYSVDYRVVRPDKQLMWVHEQAEVFFEKDRAAFVVGVVQDITERKVNDQKIRESKHNLDALINNTSDFMWSCDEKLRLISGNKAFHARMRERYGIDLREGDSVIVPDGVHPAMEAWNKAYETALSGKQAVFETHVERSTGPDYFLNTLNPILDNGKVVGVAGFSRNITESKKFENHIKAINERYEILSKATNDAVWDFDMKADTITWNHGLASIYGYYRDSYQRQTSFQWWRSMVHPDDLNFVVASLERSFAKKEQLWTRSYRFRCANGNYRYALDRGFIIYEGDKPVRMIGAQQDVHELTEYRMNLEQKVIARTIELQEALEKEKQLSEMKSRFVSIASHEFRTPLSTIQFATDFLARYKYKLGEPDIDRKLASISAQVKHMLFLLDDVLTVSKGDSGKIKVNVKPMNLREFLSELAKNIEEGAKSGHEIRLHFQLGNDIVTSDEKLLTNIFTNLLSNAIKFSPDQKTVELTCVQRDGRLIIEVADNGIGINEKERDLIFEPFSRGADVGAISGTGLGLSIVKTAVKLLQGTIELTSTEKFKTVFRVVIPLSLAE